MTVALVLSKKTMVGEDDEDIRGEDEDEEDEA